MNVDPLVSLVCVVGLLLLFTADGTWGATAGGGCVFSDRCFGAGGSESYPCPYNGSAFNNETLPICKQYQDAHCCTVRQLDDLSSYILQTAKTLVGRCPAAYENIVDLACSYICAPNQADYVKVLDTSQHANLTYVNHTFIHIDDPYSQLLWESVDHVQFGATGKTVVDLVCGASNAEELLVYLVGMFSYQIDFLQTHDAPLSMNLSSTSRLCKTSCSCNDCPDACVLPPTPSIQENHLFVGKMPLLSFVLLMIWIVMFLLFVFVTIVFKVFGGKFCNHMKEENIAEVLRETSQKSRSFLIPSGYLSRYFIFHGKMVVTMSPCIVPVTILISIVLGIGLYRTTFIKDPQELWSSSTSDTGRDKSFFDNHFEPFWRIEQFIVTRKDGGAMARNDSLYELFELESWFAAINISYADRWYTELDLCYRPVMGKGCYRQSVLEYFQEDLATFLKTDVRQHIRHCADENNLIDMPCRTSLGMPLAPDLVFGGFKGEGVGFENATAAFVTYMLNDHLNENDNVPAEMWERVFLDILLNNEFSVIDIAFIAQRSLQDEIGRENDADVVTVAISYVVMFIYICLSLGEILSFNPKRAALNSRLFIGVSGMITVVCALACSLGVCGWAKVEATLIISEVIPFLVLAIGTDNMFLIVHAFDRTDRSLSVKERMGDALHHVGLSIAIAAFSETFAFLLGALTKMPAVEAFVYYTSIAIFCDFVLQMSLFVALLSWNEIRMAKRRVELIPCVKVETLPEPREGWIHRIIRCWYVPFIVNAYGKMFVILFTLGVFFGGVALLPHVQLGLDQEVVLPTDSYLIPFFDRTNEYLETGLWPAFFVVHGMDFAKIEDQDKICSFGNSTCEVDSLLNFLRVRAMRPDDYYIIGSVASFFDDFVMWLRSPDQCCGMNPDHTYCNPADYCPLSCDITLSAGNRPNATEFYFWLPYFLNSTPSDQCAMCGSPYQGDLAWEDDETVLGGRRISAARFRISQRVLITQNDFVTAYKRAFNMAKDVSNLLGVPVFAYSYFYVFFEQYLYISRVAIETLLFSGSAVFVVTFLLLMNPVIALVVVGVAAMVVIDVVGYTGVVDVNLNAVSVVNYSMAMGISIEFVAHVTYGFLRTEGKKNMRAAKSIVEMGTSVFSGITMTKFFGVVVLAFSRSKVFQIYYFRMYLAMVLFGALHGLFYLPVLLSIIGPCDFARIRWPFKKKRQVDEDDEAESSALLAGGVLKYSGGDDMSIEEDGGFMEDDFGGIAGPGLPEDAAEEEEADPDALNVQFEPEQ